MADFVQTMKDWMRMCEHCDRNEKIGCVVNGSVCAGFCKMKDEIDLEAVEAKVTTWAAEHPEPVYETWFEYLLRIGVIPVNAPAGGEYQWIVESIKHKHISNDIAESLKLHPKEVQS